VDQQLCLVAAAISGRKPEYSVERAFAVVERAVTRSAHSAAAWNRPAAGPLFAAPAQVLALALAQLGGLRFDALFTQVEIDEDRDLGAQDVGFERLDR